MSESKKGVHQISPNSFLFFNTPEIFYYIYLEQVDTSKIKIDIIKILENNTNIFESIVNFSDFGTGDTSPQDTIKNLDFIIYNYNFVIKEEKDKINILINSKNPKNIELSLLKLNMEDENIDESNYIEQMNQMENKIEEFKIMAEKQEKEINLLQQNEYINMNKIKQLDKFTENLLSEIGNNNYNNQTNITNINYNSNQYNNNSNNNNINPYYKNNNIYNNDNNKNTNTIKNPYSANNNFYEKKNSFDMNNNNNNIRENNNINIRNPYQNSIYNVNKNNNYIYQNQNTNSFNPYLNNNNNGQNSQY